MGDIITEIAAKTDILELVNNTQLHAALIAATAGSMWDYIAQADLKLAHTPQESWFHSLRVAADYAGATLKKGWRRAHQLAGGVDTPPPPPPSVSPSLPVQEGLLRARWLEVVQIELEWIDELEKSIASPDSAAYQVNVQLYQKKKEAAMRLYSQLLRASHALGVLRLMEDELQRSFAGAQTRDSASELVDSLTQKRSVDFARYVVRPLKHELKVAYREFISFATQGQGQG